MAWKVPDHAIAPARSAWLLAQIRSTRRVISSAARRVNVSSRMRLGSAPQRIR